MAKPHLPPMGIYCIKNLVSGRLYVGSSIKISRRFNDHRSALRTGKHVAVAMQRSWLKHGAEAFEFSILEEVIDLADLIPAEQRWIDVLDAANPKTGFNTSPTAGNCLGCRHSDKTKAHQSAIRKGVPKSAAHRAAIGDAHRGRTRTAEERAITAEGVRKHFVEHPEARERMREVGRRNGLASKGRTLSQSARDAMSKARAGNGHYRDIALTNLAKANPEKMAAARRSNGKARAGLPFRENRKLTFEQAEKIRALKIEGVTYDQLEKEFGVNRCSLHHIVKGKTYQRP